MLKIFIYVQEAFFKTNIFMDFDDYKHLQSQVCLSFVCITSVTIHCYYDTYEKGVKTFC